VLVINLAAVLRGLKWYCMLTAAEVIAVIRSMEL
jgi:hypothetical protein